eukprot:13911935-Heterocapsa_arctica.AAC.1
MRPSQQGLTAGGEGPVEGGEQAEAGGHRVMHRSPMHLSTCSTTTRRRHGGARVEDVGSLVASCL